MSTQIVCDHCAQRVERTPTKLILPPAVGCKDFCGLECVSAWITAEPARAARRREVFFTTQTSQTVRGFDDAA